MAYRPSAGRNQVSSSVPKVPDLVPLMNLFLTIIPFLILMLVITQVALVAFNFSEGAIPPGETDSNNGVKSDVPEFTVIIMASQDSTKTTYPGFEIRVPARGPNSPVVDSLGLVNGRYDFKKLDLTLKDIKTNYPDLMNISVAPYDDVQYENLMKTIDLCRSNNFTNVKYKAPQVRYFGVGSK